MIRLRNFAIAAFAALGACSPASDAKKETQPASGQEIPDPAPQAITDAVNAVLTNDLGQPVSFDTTHRKIENDWAFVVGTPEKADGSALDFSTTRYAQRLADGVLDGGGTTYALLHKEGERWQVMEFVVGPTDVAWATWPQQHGAPESVFELPSE